jgi:hypothetical protein
VANLESYSGHLISVQRSSIRQTSINSLPLWKYGAVVPLES